MIGAYRRTVCGPGALGRRVAPRAAAGEQPVVALLSADGLAIEVVRHLNAGDLDGFRRVVAPTVQLAAGAERTAVSAAELFARLSTMAPRQTLCASRIRAVEGGARIDLEIAWPVAEDEVAASSLGTLELECAAGRVSGLRLDLDLDPSLSRAAAALAATRGGGVRRWAAR
jgi:hypothetical protein